MPEPQAKGQGAPTFASRKRHARPACDIAGLDAGATGRLAKGMRRTAPFVILLQRLAWLAMLLPFLALSSLPSGVMPGQAADGTLTLVLCTTDGPREVAVDLGTGEPHETRQGCPFALLHSAAVLPAGASALAAPMVVLPPDFAHWHAAHLYPAHVPGPRTARAPPAFA